MAHCLSLVIPNNTSYDPDKRAYSGQRTIAAVHVVIAQLSAVFMPLRQSADSLRGATDKPVCEQLRLCCHLTARRTQVPGRSWYLKLDHASARLEPSIFHRWVLVELLSLRSTTVWNNCCNLEIRYVFNIEARNYFKLQT